MKDRSDIYSQPDFGPCSARLQAGMCLHLRFGLKADATKSHLARLWIQARVLVQQPFPLLWRHGNAEYSSRVCPSFATHCSIRTNCCSNFFSQPLRERGAQAARRNGDLQLSPAPRPQGNRSRSVRARPRRCNNTPRRRASA